MYLLRVEFKYTVKGQGIITCNREWWEVRGGGGGAGGSVGWGFGGEVATRQSFLNRSLDPPLNKKFLDPPLKKHVLPLQ